MEAWSQYFTPHARLSYHPFGDVGSNKVATEVPTLQDLCKLCIVKSLTLRRLPRGVDQLGLPALLRRYLKSLTTKDFDLKDNAPFHDICGLNFVHRALTYRLRCRLDGQKYLVSHAFWIMDTCNTKETQLGWSSLQHPNIMSIYGLVEDTATGNFFYIFDFPRISLDRLRYITEVRNLEVPELFLWRLLADVGSALKYLLCFNLSYQHCDLSNVFVVGDRLVLENGLIRKVWDTVSCHESENVGGKNLPDPEREALRNLRKMVNEMVERRGWIYSRSLSSLIRSMKRNKSLSATLDVVHAKLSSPDASHFSIAAFMDDLKNTNAFSF